jgi:hypothetical protein
LLLALLACGCGTDDDYTTPTRFESCKFLAPLSGAVEEDVELGDQHGCGGAGDAPAQILVLGWGVGPALNVKLTIEQIDAGQTGSHAGFIELRDGEKLWRAAAPCDVEITEFNAKENDADSYEIKGNGNCSADLDPIEGGASGTISMGAFLFQSIAGY